MKTHFLGREPLKNGNIAMRALSILEYSKLNVKLQLASFFFHFFSLSLLKI